MLYEIAIRFTEEALGCLRSGDVLKRGQAVNKAIEAIFELQRSLRHDVQPEYSQNLAGLYNYLLQRLGEAHAHKSEGMFEEAARLLHTLEEGWNGATQNLEALPRASQPAEVPVAVSAGLYPGDASTGPTPGRSWSL